MPAYPYEPVPAIIDLYDRAEEIDFDDEEDDEDADHDEEEEDEAR